MSRSIRYGSEVDLTTVLIIDEAVAFGGSIVSTANLIRGLDRTRFEPIFVTASSEEHVRGKLMEASGLTRVIVARKALDYARLQRLRGVILDVVPFTPLRKALIYLLYFLRLFLNVPYTLRIGWAIVRYGVDIVQFNNGFGNDEAALPCRLLRREPIVFIRGYSPAGLIDRLFLKGRVKRYVAVSQFERENAMADGVPDDRVVVATPSAVPEPSPVRGEAVRRQLGIDGSAHVVAIFGRIVRWKGQIQFLRAVSDVIPHVPDLRVLIVGDSSDGDESFVEEVRELIEELGIGEHVIFTGYVDDVHAYYRAVDVVAHASIEPEPSGRVIFEAMSNAVPVIASCLGGPVEFIEDGVDGFLVDPHDRTTFAERMTRLLTDRELRCAVGKRGKEKVDRFYSLEAYAKLVEAAYEDVLRSA